MLLVYLNFIYMEWYILYFLVTTFFIQHYTCDEYKSIKNSDFCLSFIFLFSPETLSILIFLKSPYKLGYIYYRIVNKSPTHIFKLYINLFNKVLIINFLPSVLFIFLNYLDKTIYNTHDIKYLLPWFLFSKLWFSLPPKCFIKKPLLDHLIGFNQFTPLLF